MPPQGRKRNGPARKRQLSERLSRDIAIVREMMLTVHYFAESSWLLAAVEYPALCGTETAQQALRNAARIAWQFGFPNVSCWLNEEIVVHAPGAASSPAADADGLQDPSTEPA